VCRTQTEDESKIPTPPKSTSNQDNRTDLTPNAAKMEEKPREVRKLFPIFDKSNWLSRKMLHSETRQTTVSSRKRMHKQSGEDPLEDFKIKRKKWISAKGNTGKDVYFLDAGQRSVGHQTCKVCGMVYTLGLPEDEEVHLKFHNGYISGINFPGWKNEHFVTKFEDGRLIFVVPTDPKNWIKKVTDICKMVDAELGYADSVPVFRESSKAFLFISTHKRVVGCIVTDNISKGYRLLPANSEAGNSGVPWCCSLESEKAVLGINRMWVSLHYRRKKVATRMLDAIRAHHEGGIPKELIAFSDPSPSGRKFAERYLGTQTFLVYQWYC
jgi:N-acetyltransferase